MSSGLSYFIYLIDLKNQVNRRRRRFLSKYYEHNYALRILSIPHYIDRLTDRRRENLLKRKLSAKELAIVCNGYRAAQKEMKSMTPAIKELRLQLEAEILWGSSGNVFAIRAGNKRIDARQFKFFVEDYLADEILLG